MRIERRERLFLARTFRDTWTWRGTWRGTSKGARTIRGLFDPLELHTTDIELVFCQHQFLPPSDTPLRIFLRFHESRWHSAIYVDKVHSSTGGSRKLGQNAARPWQIPRRRQKTTSRVSSLLAVCQQSVSSLSAVCQQSVSISWTGVAVRVGRWLPGRLICSVISNETQAHIECETQDKIQVWQHETPTDIECETQDNILIWKKNILLLTKYNISLQSPNKMHLCAEQRGHFMVVTGRRHLTSCAVCTVPTC